MRPALPLRLAAVLLVAVAAAPAAAAAAARPIQIRTLSNRADLISDGNALVRITLPRGARAKRLKVTVGRRDVTRAFTHRDGRALVGIVDRLALGRNRLVAK